MNHKRHEPWPNDKNSKARRQRLRGFASGFGLRKCQQLLRETLI